MVEALRSVAGDAVASRVRWAARSGDRSHRVDVARAFHRRRRPRARDARRSGFRERRARAYRGYAAAIIRHGCRHARRAAGRRAAGGRRVARLPVVGSTRDADRERFAARARVRARSAAASCAMPRRRAAARTRARHRRRSSPRIEARPRLACAPRCCSACRSPARSTPTTSRRAFGADVATLVAGVARMDAIRAIAVGADAPSERAAQAENLRKMLLAMVEDIRVVLIKLAERTQALRYLMTGDAERCARRGRARGARPVRAARQPPRRLAAQVGARGPVAARARARDLQARSRGCSTSAALDRERYIDDVIAHAARELAARRASRPR